MSWAVDTTDICPEKLLLEVQSVLWTQLLSAFSFNALSATSILVQLPSKSSASAHAHTPWECCTAIVVKSAVGIIAMGLFLQCIECYQHPCTGAE